MSTFPAKSILRFYPSNDATNATNATHYSAVVVKDGSIFEIKSPDNREKASYATLDLWFASLPGTPSIENLQVDTEGKLEAKQKAESKAESQEKPEKKQKKQKPAKCNLPGRNNHIKSLGWLRLIYSMMKQANKTLISNEAVITAFNKLYDCLLKYDGIIETKANVPHYSKYQNVIKLDDKAYCNTRGIPGAVVQLDLPNERRNAILDDICATYQPLYDLIKRDVIPYLEMKTWEFNKKIDGKRYRRLIDHIETQIKQIQIRTERQLMRRQDTIGRYAKYLVELQTPPVLTKFD